MDEVTPVYASLAEMEKALSDEAKRLDRAETQLADARRQYDQNVTNHPHETVRAAHEQVYAPILADAERETEKLATLAKRNARTVASATAKTQLTLSPEEWQAAEARRGFIREQCQDWPLSRLADVVRHALVTDDRAAMYAYGEYVPRWLALGDRDELGEWSQNPAARERSELQRMLDVIRERLQDRRLAPIHERASELSRRAGRLARDASQRRRAEELKRHPFPFTSPGDVNRWEVE